MFFTKKIESLYTNFTYNKYKKGFNPTIVYIWRKLHMWELTCKLQHIIRARDSFDGKASSSYEFFYY